VKIDDIKAKLEDIKRLAHDDEAAHGMEDALHWAVLSAIASGELEGYDARTAANLAMATADIDFSRWCA